MPALIPAAIIAILPSTAATAFTIGATAFSYATVISTVLVAAGSYAAASSMKQTPDFSSLENSTAGKLSLSRSTTPSQRGIYGTQRVSGPVAYVSTTGAKNRELHMIVLLAGHECNLPTGSSAGHNGIFLNDVLAIDKDGNVQSPFNSGNLEALYKNGGAGQTAYTITGDTEWTTGGSARTLDGICSVYVHMIHDPQVYPSGIPNVSVIVEGKPCLDLRDSGTRWTDNPALILYDYLTTQFGATASEIHTSSFIDCANICDEIVTGSVSANNTKRYTCNMTYQMSERPADIIENILKSCYGKLLYVNGQFQMRVGAFSTPTVTLNESDLRAGLSVTTKAASSQAYNKVTGLYVDGSNGVSSSFQSAEFVPVSSSYYLAEDNGIESVINLEFPTVTNERQARRLAKLALLDSRQDLVVNYPCKPSGLQLIAGDTVKINNTRFGWSEKIFEIQDLSINPDLSVDLTLKETAASMYEWASSDQDVDSDLSPNTNLPDPFAVDAVTGFALTETTTTDVDGTIFPSVTANWDDVGSGSIANIELDFKDNLSASWSSLAKLTNAATEYTTIDVLAGHTYDFRIRQYNYFGVYSPYASASISVLGDNVAPQAPTSMVVTGGTGSLYVTWVNDPVDKDYAYTQVWMNTTNASASAVNQGTVSGTSWNRTISSSSVYYVWLKNLDTSGNQSSVAAAGNASVAAVGTGAIGPSGSAGDYWESRYVVYDVTPTVSDNTNVSPTGTAGSWSTTVPNADGSAVWVITGKKNAAGTVMVTVWSSPTRFAGNVHWYQTSAPSSPITGDWWFNTTSGTKRWYRYNGSSWVDAESLITLPDFPSTFQPVSIGSALPSLPNASYPNGSTFCVTTTGVLYRNLSGTWTAAVATNVLSGTITETQIASGSISSPLIKANAITGDKIAANSITASQIVANSITSGLIAAGAITASHIGSNTIIVNSANISSSVINDSHIISLRAGQITAGTITAAVTMSAAYISAGQIGSDGLTIQSTRGLRYRDNNGNFIITGGSDNGENNGAQVDLVGVGGGSAGIRGTMVISAGNVGTSDGDGTIRFRTAGTEQGKWKRDGTLEINHNVTTNAFKGAHIRFGSSAGYTDRAISANFGDQACLTFAGGTGITGVLASSEAHRWVDSGNANELMALTAGGDLYIQTNAYGDAFITPSARKLKKNIRPLTGALAIISKLEAKTFDWWDESKKNDIGCIADEVVEVLPNIVYRDEAGEISGMDYAKLTPILLQAIKEQSVIIDNLRQRVTRLERM